MMEPYAGKRCYVVADPAGAQRSQYTEETAFDVLKSAWVPGIPRR